MFLEMLKKEQKELFLQLAVIATEANGKVEENEKEMLIKFANEMNVEPIDKADKSFDDIINELASISDKREKKIILFETVGIMNSDGDFDVKETEFLSKIAAKFEINNEILEDMMYLVTTYIDLFDAIIGTVLEDEEENE